MAKWINHVAIASPRNGTSSHTASPWAGAVVAGSAFTPTAGNYLLVICNGAVTFSTPAGWSFPAGGSVINNAGLYAFTKTATGSDTVATMNNGSNYPVVFDFYEFAGGSALAAPIYTSLNTPNGVANPVRPALSGTNLIMWVASTCLTGTAGPFDYSWSAGTEVTDVYALQNVTDGYALGVAYVEDYAGSSSPPSSPTLTPSLGISQERMTFAVKATASGGGPTVVTKSVGSTWNVRARATRTAGGTWKIRGRIATSSPAQWQVRGRVIRSTGIDGSWSVRAAVTTTATAAWGIRAATAKTVVLRWHDRFGVDAPSWVFAGWSVRLMRSRTAPAAWAVRARTERTVAATWSVRIRSAISVAVRWSTRTQSVKAVVLRWPVLGRVMLDRPVSWNVGSDAGTALKLVAAGWANRTAGAVAISTSWATRRTVTAVASMAWNARMVAGRVLGVVWALRIRSARLLSSSWALRIQGVQVVSSSWAIRLRSGQTLTASWNARVTAEHVREARWHIRAQVVIVAAAGWDIRARAVHVVAIQWSTNSNLVVVVSPGTPIVLSRRLGGSPLRVRRRVGQTGLIMVYRRSR